MYIVQPLFMVDDKINLLIDKSEPNRTEPWRGQLFYFKLIFRIADRLNDWLIDWLIDWLVGWLIDWFFN